MSARDRPITLRFSACLRLSTGEIAGIQFDFLHEAVSFSKRISDPGDWWEVCDNRTRNVVSSSDRPK